MPNCVKTRGRFFKTFLPVFWIRNWIRIDFGRAKVTHMKEKVNKVKKFIVSFEDSRLSYSLEVLQ
jgi:hypothetical protein